MEITNKIQCPKCNYAFDISDVLIQRVKKSYDADFNARNEEFEKNWKMKLEAAEKTVSESKKREQTINDIISQAVDKKLKTEKLALSKKIRAELNKETSEQMETYEIQLKEKTKAYNSPHCQDRFLSKDNCLMM